MQSRPHVLVGFIGYLRKTNGPVEKFLAESKLFDPNLTPVRREVFQKISRGPVGITSALEAPSDGFVAAIKQILNARRVESILEDKELNRVGKINQIEKILKNEQVAKIDVKKINAILKNKKIDPEGKIQQIREIVEIARIASYLQDSFHSELKKWSYKHIKELKKLINNRKVFIEAEVMGIDKREEKRSKKENKASKQGQQAEQSAEKRKEALNKNNEFTGLVDGILKEYVLTDEQQLEYDAEREEQLRKIILAFRNDNQGSEFIRFLRRMIVDAKTKALALERAEEICIKALSLAFSPEELLVLEGGEFDKVVEQFQDCLESNEEKEFRELVKPEQIKDLFMRSLRVASDRAHDDNKLKLEGSEGYVASATKTLEILSRNAFLKEIKEVLDSRDQMVGPRLKAHRSRLAKHGTQLANCVIEEILSADEYIDRVALLTKWARQVQSLEFKQDYYSMHAILHGLNSIICLCPDIRKGLQRANPLLGKKLDGFIRLFHSWENNPDSFSLESVRNGVPPFPVLNLLLSRLQGEHLLALEECITEQERRSQQPVQQYTTNHNLIHQIQMSNPDPDKRRYKRATQINAQEEEAKGNLISFQAWIVERSFLAIVFTIVTNIFTAIACCLAYARRPEKPNFYTPLVSEAKFADEVNKRLTFESAKDSKGVPEQKGPMSRNEAKDTPERKNFLQVGCRSSSAQLLALRGVSIKVDKPEFANDPPSPRAIPSTPPDRRTPGIVQNPLAPPLSSTEKRGRSVRFGSAYE